MTLVAGLPEQKGIPCVSLGQGPRVEAGSLSNRGSVVLAVLVPERGGTWHRGCWWLRWLTRAVAGVSAVHLSLAPSRSKPQSRTGVVGVG